MPGHEKNKRSRQKRDGNTPDKEEDAASNPDSQRKTVIFNEEIAQLQIKEDNLQSLSQTSAEEILEQTYQKVAVRKEIPEAERKPVQKRVGLLKRAPPDAQVQNPDTDSHIGPRFDDCGKVVAHSILGSPEEFYKLAVLKGQLKAEDVPEIYRTPRSTARLSVKYARKQTFPFPVKDLAAEENAALKNWEKRMAERKRQQGYISKLIQRSPADLVMNGGEKHRNESEKKHLIDRSIPFYDYGKGYRAGTEFWQQADRIGDEETGVHVTLTQTQKGYPPAIEHVGHSRLAKAERGLDWEPSPRKGGGYPWKGPFYHQRTSQLKQVMDELDPYQPEFESLEVIGRAPGHVTVRSRPTTAVTPSISRQSQGSSAQGSEQLPPMSSGSGNSRYRERKQEDQEANTGPSLRFGGQPARWFGDPNSYKDTVGIEARVILETRAGKPTSQCLNIENDGTTALFYRWKKLPKPNPFNLVQQEVKQFYFDTSNGVLLPGESLHFPFIFKSDKPGLFAEQWQLETTPVVCGGAALVVTLRGIAVQEDLNAGKRSELEARLTHQTARKIVQALLDEILDGIQIPERPKTPIDAYITPEQVFLRRNPGLSYTLDTLNMMRKLHKDTLTQGGEAEARDWDLNVRTLRDEVLELQDDKQGKKEELTGKLFNLVNRISFGIDLPRAQCSTRQYQQCYFVVMETMDRIYNDWYRQRAIRRLPEIEMDFPDPSTAAKDAKAKRGKADKQKSNVSKDSGKAGLRTESSRISMTKERTKSPRRVSSGRQTSIDAGRSFVDQPAEDTVDADEFESPEALAERLCKERIYANTFCMLGDMVENIADLCEAQHTDS